MTVDTQVVLTLPHFTMPLTQRERTYRKASDLVNRISKSFKEANHYTNVS